ncbi:MAG: hypothetical protein ABEK50_15325 [bacterium]
MTRFSKWAIRLSLGYMLIGFTIGGLMLANKGFLILPSVPLYLPVHIEYMMVGWFIHLIFGVAYWMFPRFTPKETGLRPRGFVRAAWGSLLLLNIGLVIFTTGQLVTDKLWFRFLGRSFEVIGTLAFFVNLWPRIKPVKKP